MRCEWHNNAVHAEALMPAALMAARDNIYRDLTKSIRMPPIMSLHKMCAADCVDIIVKHAADD